MFEPPVFLTLILARNILQTNGLRAISPLAISMSSRRLEGIEIGTDTFLSCPATPVVLVDDEDVVAILLNKHIY